MSTTTGNDRKARRRAKTHQSGTPYGAPLSFIDRVLTSATDECIIWPYAISDNGYGKVNVDGRMRNVHRVVLERTAGPAPEGACAAHAPLVCHNRACVNPRHLRWATPKQNSDDKLIDGDTNRGERHGNSKLAAAQVLAIFRDPRPSSTIAAEHGVTKGAVLSIKAGRTWGWLTHTSKAV